MKQLTNQVRETHTVLSKDHILRLQDFNKLGERLINSSFIKESKEKNPHRTYSWRVNEQTDNLKFSYSRDRIHNEDTIMAFVLTLRQLIQRDPTSIRKMAKLYEEMPIDENYKIEFRNLRKRFNDYLGSQAITTLADDPTIEKILRTIIYGEYAHLDDAKKELLKKWQTYEGDWDMVLGEFEVALNECVRMITPMKELNERVLKQYSSKSA
jgi:hypothetical protein